MRCTRLGLKVVLPGVQAAGVQDVDEPMHWVHGCASMAPAVAQQKAWVAQRRPCWDLGRPETVELTPKRIPLMHYQAQHGVEPQAPVGQLA